MPRPKQARGFTLIELLVVIAIIGLLMTLLVPAVTKANEMVRAIQTRGILKDLSIGLEAFKKDFGDYPPSRPVKYFDGTTPMARYQPPGSTYKDPPDVVPDNMGTGAANLVFYLYGPDRVGWGTVGGGAMPFGGPPQRAYGPYYQCAEGGVRLKKLKRSFTVRGQSLTHAATGFLDAYKPPGVILYLRSYKREMKDAQNRVYYIQGYDPTDNDRPDTDSDTTLSKSDSDYTKYNYGEPKSGSRKQQDLFDLAIGVWGRDPNSTHRTVLRRYPRQDYVLISPGPDGRYGYVGYDKQTGEFVAWDPNTGDETHDGLAQFDDVGNWEK